MSSNTRRVSLNQRRFLLQEAVKKLCRYHGVQSQLDLLSTVGLSGNPNPTQEQLTNPINVSDRTPVSLEGEIMQIMFDDSVGARKINEIIAEINSIISGSDELRQKFIDTFEIYWIKDTNGDSIQQPIGIREMFPNVQPTQAPISTANGTASSPSGGGSAPVPATTSETYNTEGGETKPNLSATIVNTSQVSFNQRMNNAATLFFNTIPNIDLNMISPYIEINFRTPRSPTVSDSDTRINGLSLMKFLEGAKRIESNTPDYFLTIGNSIANPRAAQTAASAGSTTPNPTNPEKFTQAGMELFTSPQSLVNAEFSDNPSIHSQKILDKFQPFLSLNSLDLNLVPTHGLMSNKTGTISMKLHDKSRLSDIAEFIRPEYYGSNEILIEYGWYHPQGELIVNGDLVTQRNYVADLLNGMRIVEKYQIINSSFNISDNGEVDITLTISMRGGTNLDTASILSNDTQVVGALQAMTETQETITRLRNAIFGNGNTENGSGTRPTIEIRGSQILDAAADGTNHLIFTQELRTALEQMKSALSRTGGAGARADRTALIQQLEEYATNVGNIQTNMASMLSAKFQQLKSGEDPFKVNALRNLGIEENSREYSLLNSKLQIPNSGEAARFVASIGASQRQEGCFSLAKLLLLFVGMPLMGTGNYDDIQFYFYPFNINAAKANRINVGEYLINADLFFVKFMQWRLGNLGQSANVSIRDFLTWMAATFFDDSASPVYGLTDLYKRVTNAEGTSVEARAVPTSRGEDRNTNFMLRLNQLISDYTPTGEFRVPQIEFNIECLPAKAGVGIDENKTILKIHVFDRLNNPYESLQQLNKLTRDNTIASVGLAISQVNSANATAGSTPSARASATERETREGTIQAGRNAYANYNNYIKEAERRKIIEPVPNSNPIVYRMAGGTNSARRLKEFFYSVTPYIIHGSAASVIKSAGLKSMQNSRLTTVNFLRNHTASPLEPNGENPGGLPMQIIPTELEMDIVGCTFINFAQTFFIDFNTGTTADNFYTVTGVRHSLSQGAFNTQIKFSPTDAYGQYINILQQVNRFQNELRNMSGEVVGGSVDKQPQPPSPPP